MVLYLAIKQRLYHADIGSYTAYGLPAVFIPDVTTDRREARHLARLCTVGQLDPNQLCDVVEDAIS